MSAAGLRAQKPSPDQTALRGDGARHGTSCSPMSALKLILLQKSFSGEDRKF